MLFGKDLMLGRSLGEVCLSLLTKLLSALGFFLKVVSFEIMHHCMSPGKNLSKC